MSMKRGQGIRSHIIAERLRDFCPLVAFAVAPYFALFLKQDSHHSCPLGSKNGPAKRAAPPYRALLAVGPLKC